MKIEKANGPAIIVGKRVLIGQAVMGAVNTAVVLWNHVHPENPIDGAIAGYMSQPIILGLQMWWVNKKGVTL